MRSDQGFNLFLTLAKDVLLISKQPKEEKRKEKELVFGSVDKSLVSLDPPDFLLLLKYFWNTFTHDSRPSWKNLFRSRNTQWRETGDKEV